MLRVFILTGVMILLLKTATAQTIPDLPIPIGAATAKVWNNEIYLFGGSNNWSGSILYPRVYRFDGFTWSHYDSIPDNNVWDVESVMVGDMVYLISGWPYGSTFLRSYHLPTRHWEYLASSPNGQTWGVSAEYLNGMIYLFSSYGNVYAYDISANIWTEKTANEAVGTWDLSSILYKNEIYIIGFDDSTFYKYTPLTDDWTALAKSPYQVGACAMGVINDSIYCVGGNNDGSRYAAYRGVIAYDIPANTWSTDSSVISGRRHWMSTAEYQGGLYVLGGIDSLGVAVIKVEEIVPQGTALGIKPVNSVPGNYLLRPNFPNPFNPSTTIVYRLPATGTVELIIYNLMGERVSSLVNMMQSAGDHTIQWDGTDDSGVQVPSGVYMCRIRTNANVDTRKMILIR